MVPYLGTKHLAELLPTDINWQRSELPGHGRRDGIPGVQVATVQIAARCRPAATTVQACQNS